MRVWIFDLSLMLANRISSAHEMAKTIQNKGSFFCLIEQTKIKSQNYSLEQSETASSQRTPIFGSMKASTSSNSAAKAAKIELPQSKHKKAPKESSEKNKIINRKLELNFLKFD
ncbi:MAG: hypothetical protein H0U73_06025 [Tatlockia sp.]|nr:hypothetical protein [Tatlockia sp.]